MSKEYLLNTMRNIQIQNYSWSLYFLKIDGRNRNPYYVYKHTFSNPNYLPEYINALRDTIIQYQIEAIETVQDYDGENSKTSCDKLDVNNQLIVEQWNNMVTSVAGAPREQIQGKYQGYVLEGQSQIEGFPSIVMVKSGNPIINLDNKNSKVFKHTPAGELEDMTDELCRLYLSIDFFVISETLYTFNHNFEGIFRMEKTLHRLKVQAIEYIIRTNAFKEAENVQLFMNAYTSPKTFLTLNTKRVEKLNSLEGRREIANTLKLEIDSTELILRNQEQANTLIKYLCYKIFQDKETDNLIEVNSVVNDNVLNQ